MGWFSQDTLLDNIDIEDDDVTVYHVCLVIALVATCIGLGYRIYMAYTEDSGGTVQLKATTENTKAGGGGGGGVGTIGLAVSALTGQDVMQGLGLTLLVVLGNYCIFVVGSAIVSTVLGNSHFDYY